MNAKTPKMNTVMVCYRVKAERVTENERLVREVYEQLAAERPQGFRYATFKHDETSFMHVAAIDDGVENPLPALAAFKRFQEGIAERCEQQPVVTSLQPVGSFGLLEADAHR
jgi:hypothetical protein